MTTATIQTIKSKFQLEFDPNETLKVLTHNLVVYWTWGISRKFNLQNKALVLKVNARRHKAYVVITLAWSDTYSVYLVNTNGTIKKEFTEVYFDMLTKTIDDEIEKSTNL